MELHPPCAITDQEWLGCSDSVEMEKECILKILGWCRVILVRIFPHSDWIRIDSPYVFVFGPIVGKYRPQQLQIRTLFLQFHQARFHIVVILEIWRWSYNAWMLRVEYFEMKFKHFVEHFKIYLLVFLKPVHNWDKTPEELASFFLILNRLLKKKRLK